MDTQLEIRIAYADWYAQEARIVLNEIRENDSDAVVESLEYRAAVLTATAAKLYRDARMWQHERACKLAVSL